MLLPWYLGRYIPRSVRQDIFTVCVTYLVHMHCLLLGTKPIINTFQLLFKNVSQTHYEKGYPEWVEIHFSTFYLWLMTYWHWVPSRLWRIVRPIPSFLTSGDILIIMLERRSFNLQSVSYCIVLFGVVCSFLSKPVYLIQYVHSILLVFLFFLVLWKNLQESNTWHTVTIIIFWPASLTQCSTYGGNGEFVSVMIAYIS